MANTTKTIVPISEGGRTGASWAGGTWSEVDEPGAPNDADYIQAGAAGGIYFNCQTIPSALSVSSVGVTLRDRFHGAYSDHVSYPFLRIGGVKYNLAKNNPFNYPAYQTMAEQIWLTNPATSSAWTSAAVNVLQIGWEYETGTGEGASFSQIFAKVIYNALPSSIESSRELGTRRLRLRRLPNGIIEARIPSLEYIDQELVDLMGVSHPELPSFDGLGAGVKPWQRWPCVKIRSEIQWEAGVEVVQLRDLRDYLVTFWDVGKSLKNSTTALDGLARLTSSGRVWTRDSPCYVVAPSGENVILVPAGSEKLDKDGLLFEGARTNALIQSGFKNGTFTGWTRTGESGPAVIAADASELLFDATVCGQSVKFTAGTAPAADLQVASTATASFSASAIVRLSVWHKDDSGYPLYYAIQRNTGGNWWRDSDSTWQAAKTWNPLPVSALRGRHKSKQINVGGSVTTLTVVVGLQTACQPSQVNHAYHVQIELGNFMSSAILTEAAAVIRAADQLLITNDSQGPSWPPDRGTFRAYVVPEWDDGDVAFTNKTVASVRHNATNYEWVYYDGTNFRWVYERMAAGVAYRAVKAATPVAGTIYKIAARWTSSLGELDLPAHTLSIFVNGVKGTDGAAAALQIESSATLEIGAKLAAEHFDGSIWAQEITQQALDDQSAGRH